jgi:hypothetical protein
VSIQVLLLEEFTIRSLLYGIFGCPKEGMIMKVTGLIPRNVLVLASLCLLFFFVCASPSQAQNSFTYPPFPANASAGLQTNGNASITGGVLQVTPASASQTSSAWYTNPAGSEPAPISLLNGFTTTFTFQFTNQNIPPIGSTGTNGTGGADGIAFVVQNGCFSNKTCQSTALNPDVGTGGEVGFAGLTNSVAVQFDTWCNTEYSDTCATNSPTSADQITVESCGAAANTVVHNTACQFGTVDLSTFSTPIFIGDKNPHTAKITYVPPPGSGTCSSGSTPGVGACGTLTVLLDGHTVLVAPFSLSNLGLDSNDDAFVGFTGATGGAWETQVVLSWIFGATVTQTFSTTEPTTADFSNAQGENQQTLNLGTATTLTCNGQSGGTTCPTITLLTTNNAVSASNTWPQYVNGTPWATSVCAARPSNGGAGNLCSLFVNACYGGSVSQSQADDYYCPTVSGTNNGTITLSDTWDPLDPKPTIAPGTTVSLIDFVPSAPGQTWTPSPVGQTTPPNSACTNVSTSFQCELVDSLTVVYGDQTTTRGKVPKKGWIVTVFNVPMLSTQWSVLSGAGCPTGGVNLNNNPASATTWFNSACQLQYAVNQATVAGTNTNGFVAAPPASITYGLNAAITPASGDASNTNTSLGNPWTVDPGSINTVIGGLDNQNPLPDGTYILHWSAQDNVGISEKSVQLDQTMGDTCINPVSGGNPSSFSAPCYNTNLFDTTINVDSTNPKITYTLSAPGSPALTFLQGETVNATYTCNDPLNPVASGLSSCAGQSVPPMTGGVCPASTPTVTLPLPTGTVGTNLTFTQNTVDCAGNTGSTTITYNVVPNVNLQIKTLPLLTLSVGVPGLIPVTYGAVITNQSSVAANGVTVSTTFTVPSGIVLGTPTASISTVTCTNTPCTLKGITISTTPCSVSGTSVTCSVASLGPVSAKTALWMEIIAPIAKNSKTGQFTSTSTVSSAGVPLGSVSQTYNVIF